MDLTIPVTGKEPAKGFDYSVMDKNTAKFAEKTAAEIWMRHERMVTDWLGTSTHYDEVAKAFKSNNITNETFNDWVERETPYAVDTVRAMRATARRLIEANTIGPGARLGYTKSRTLTRGDVSDEVIQAVTNRSEQGENISRAEITEINLAARNMVDGETLSSPTKANQIARDTGKPQVATDGRLYIGLSPEEVEQGKAENKLDFGIIDGVAFFSSIEISPEEWLARESSALMEWSVTEPPPIKAVIDWLTGLSKAWDVYAKTKAINGEHHEDSE